MNQIQNKLHEIEKRRKELQSDMRTKTKELNKLTNEFQDLYFQMENKDPEGHVKKLQVKFFPEGINIESSGYVFIAHEYVPEFLEKIKKRYEEE